MSTILQRVSLILVALFLAATAWADCPTPTGSYAWNLAVSVGYSFNLGTGGPPPDQDWPLDWSTMSADMQKVKDAMAIWSAADQTNISGVSFFFNGQYQNNYSGGPFYIHAYAVNYPGVYPSDPGRAAVTSASWLKNTHVIVQAVTSFYYGGYNPTIPGAPLDRNASGYPTVLTRLMLHEVGHTQGLTDQPDHGGYCLGQIAGQSVMNANCGTNDSASNIATTVTACDNQAVW
jgi:hypothetical protein